MPKLYYRNPDGSAYPDMGGFGVLAANPPQVQDEQIQTRPAYQGAPIQAPPAYQEPPIDQNEVNARLAMKRLQRDIPSGVRNPDAVVSPFEKIAVMRWKDSNRAKYDEYRAAQDIIDRADATRAARFAALDEQKAVQTNRFQFEDQQLQNELGRFRREDRPGQVYDQNTARTFAEESRAQQRKNWAQTNALDPLQVQSAQLLLQEQQAGIATKNKSVEVLRGLFGALRQNAQDEADAQVTGRPIASPGLEVTDPEGRPVNTGLSALWGPGVGSQASELKKSIATETTRLASIYSQSDDPQLLMHGLGDIGRIKTQKINEANIAADNARADRQVDNSIAMSAENNRRSVAREQLIQRREDSRVRMNIVNNLYKELRDTQAELDKINSDERGFYNKSATKGQKARIVSLRRRIEVLEAENNQKPVSGFGQQVNRDGSVSVSFDGVVVEISAERRRAIQDQILKENPGMQPGGNDHLRMLKDALEEEAVSPQ